MNFLKHQEPPSMHAALDERRRNKSGVSGPQQVDIKYFCLTRVSGAGEPGAPSKGNKEIPEIPAYHGPPTIRRWSTP